MYWRFGESSVKDEYESGRGQWESYRNGEREASGIFGGF